MSTSIENLRQLAARDVKDHTAIFDSYVVLGRDIDYLAIKFGLDPENIVNLLEGYGERIRRQKPQVVGVEEVPCEDDADLSAKPDASRKEAPAASERRKSKKRSLFSNPFRIDPEEEWTVLQENPDYDTSGCLAGRSATVLDRRIHREILIRESHQKIRRMTGSV